MEWQLFIRYSLVQKRLLLESGEVRVIMGELPQGYTGKIEERIQVAKDRRVDGGPV